MCGFDKLTTNNSVVDADSPDPEPAHKAGSMMSGRDWDGQRSGDDGGATHVISAAHERGIDER